MSALEQIVEAAPIPLVDLSRQHQDLRDEVLAVVAGIVDRGDFVLGAEVERFERDLASFCGAAHAVGVGNGTDAVELALRAPASDAGDEVILPANTFVATAQAVVRAGAPSGARRLRATTSCSIPTLSPRRWPADAAVIPVHLYGQTAAIEQIRSVVGPGLVILEDAAQAQGARRLGRARRWRSGSPRRQLLSRQEPGRLRRRRRRPHLRRRSRPPPPAPAQPRQRAAATSTTELGFNSRLDTLQAVVLGAKLRRLDDWNKARRLAAARYEALLADVPGLLTPRLLAGNEHVWHLYVVRVRAGVPTRPVLARLQAAGIGAGIHYPSPSTCIGAFAARSGRRRLPGGRAAPRRDPVAPVVPASPPTSRSGSPRRS